MFVPYELYRRRKSTRYWNVLKTKSFPGRKSFSSVPTNGYTFSSEIKRRVKRNFFFLRLRINVRPCIVHNTLKSFQNEHDTSGPVAVCVYKLRFRLWTPFGSSKVFRRFYFQMSVRCRRRRRSVIEHQWRPAVERSSVLRSSRARLEPRYPGSSYCLTKFRAAHPLTVFFLLRAESVFSPSPREYSRRRIQHAAHSAVERSLRFFLSIPSTAVCVRRVAVGTLECSTDGTSGDLDQRCRRLLWHRRSASSRSNTLHSYAMFVCKRKRQTHITTWTSNGVRYAVCPGRFDKNTRVVRVWRVLYRVR